MEKQDANGKVNMSDDIITDKAFSRSVVASMLGIVVCLIMLCSSTWAWYVDESASRVNVITTGEFTANIGVYSLVSQGESQDGTETGEGEFVYANSIDDLIYEYSFDGNAPYDVRIAVSGKAYCRIYIDGVDTIYANLFSDDGSFDFTMMLSDSATVRFELRWGTYSGDSMVVDGGVLNVTLPVGNKPDSAETSEPETEPETEPVTEPETEPVTEPVTEPETEPETQQ